MTKTYELSELEKELDAILATLRRQTAGSRSTLRIDDPARSWNVDFICAESIEPGVKSLRGDGSIDQRAAATVQWIAKNRKNLIQPDLTGNPDPAPPPALMSSYEAKAQLLGPLLDKNGELRGWISIHYVRGTHTFTPEEELAMDQARAAVSKLTGIGA